MALGFTRSGLHELQPVPDALLLALNPQVIVTVGTYEHADAINKHRARVQNLRQLLPNALIGVRWWPDDNVLEKFDPDTYADVFFPLHVPGTVLFVGNEDSNSHSDPRLFARTVKLHTEVLKLATARGIQVGTCCMSTGNPALTQYPLYAPLLREMQVGREKGVYHWLRLNRYFTETDNTHMRQHENALADACRLAGVGVAVPPIIFGEVGALRSFFEPERGYHSMGWSDQKYIDRLKLLDLPYPYAVYCWGAGVYDQRWADCAASEQLVGMMAQQLPRTPKTALEEWRAKQVQVTYKDGVIDRVLDGHANVRQSPSTTAKIIGQLVPGDRVRYNPAQINAGAAGAYRANGLTMYTWWQLESGGYAAVGVLSFADPNQIPDVPIKWLNVPHVSQIGTSAQKRNNDCGVAASKSAHDFVMQKSGLMPMKLSVDRLIEDTPLAASDAPLGVAALVNLLAVYGVKARTALNMTPAAIRAEIDADRPFIALVNYRPIGGESFGHYVVVIGYGSRGFWLHDPYKRGANVYVTTDTLEAALTEMNGIAGAPYQGVVLV